LLTDFSDNNGASDKMADQKRKVGRPSTYDPAYCDRIIEFAREGKLPEQWAARLGTTKQSLHNWADEHPEFFDAFQRAKLLSQEWWMNLAQTQALNPSAQYNFNAVKFMLSAAFGMREGTDVKQEISGANGGPVSHSVSVQFVEPPK
jgi:hypothetical protein